MARDWQPDFEQLVDQHQSMVFSIALRMTGDRGLAEEIAQDVFLELDRSLERFDTPEYALFWLRRVAISRSTDALRRRKVRCMDLWVEFEEGHGAQANDKSLSSLSSRASTACLPPCRSRSARRSHSAIRKTLRPKRSPKRSTPLWQRSKAICTEASSCFDPRQQAI